MADVLMELRSTASQMDQSRDAILVSLQVLEIGGKIFGKTGQKTAEPSAVLALVYERDHAQTPAASPRGVGRLT